MPPALLQRGICGNRANLENLNRPQPEAAPDTVTGIYMGNDMTNETVKEIKRQLRARRYRLLRAIRQAQMNDWMERYSRPRPGARGIVSLRD